MGTDLIYWRALVTHSIVPLRYRFEWEKFAQAAAFLLERCPSVTRKKLFKLLYFADKAHLLHYGRPIINDTYVNMDQGPVPSKAYDLVKHNTRAWNREVIDAFAEFIEVNGFRLRLRKSPGDDLLSASDVNVLQAVVQRYGWMNAERLSALSHRTKAWLESRRNKPIDYALFFDSPETVEIQSIAEEDQPVRDLVEDAAKAAPKSRAS